MRAHLITNTSRKPTGYLSEFDAYALYVLILSMEQVNVVLFRMTNTVTRRHLSNEGSGGECRLDQ